MNRLAETREEANNLAPPLVHIAMSVFVCPVQRVVSNIAVEIEALWIAEACIGHRSWLGCPVGSHETPQTACIVPCHEVVQSGFGVPFFAGELVVLGHLRC